MCGNDDGCSAALLCKLLDAHHIGQRIAALSAIFLRDRDAHESGLCHLLHRLAGEALRLINLLCKRLDFLLGKILEQLSCHQMLLV